MKKIIFFFAFFTFSCSTTDKYLPGVTSIFPNFILKYFKEDKKTYSSLPELLEKVKLQLVWQKNLSGKIDNNYASLNFQKYEKNLYVPTNDKKIYVVNYDNGNFVKSFESELDIFSGIIVDHNSIYFGSKQDTVTAINKKNGYVLWQRIMTSEVMSISDILDNTIFVRTNDSKISAIDVSTGNFLWVNSQIPPELSIRGVGKPIISDTDIYVGFDDGRVISFDVKNGNIQWQTLLSSSSQKLTIIDRLSDIDGTMILNKNVLFVISYQGYIAAIDTSSGKIIWSRSGSSLYGISENEKNIFFIDDNGVLWCLEKYSGNVVWNQDKLLKRIHGTPIIFNEYIIIQDVENYLHIINTFDGSISGRLTINYPIQSFYVDFDSICLLEKNLSLKKYILNTIKKK